jgi:hypothetical protein
MAERITQGVAVRVPLQAYLSSDHISPATGQTIAITISKNAAAYGNPSGGATNATEIANGSYYVDLSASDTGTLGPLWVRGAVSGIDDVIAIFRVVPAEVPGYAIVAGSTGSAVIVSGLPTGKNYVGQHLFYPDAADGGSESRKISSQSFDGGSGNYTFNFTGSALATPPDPDRPFAAVTTGDVVYLLP